MPRRRRRLLLQARYAQEDDLQDLFDWRNDSQARLMSFNSEAVAFSDHEAWFKQTLSNPDRVIVIGLDGEHKLGMVRYDRRSRVAVVGINLNPLFRGRGLAAPLLAESETAIPRSWRIESLEAKVKVTNLASLKAFESAGYRCSGGTEVAGAQTRVYRKSISSGGGEV